MLLKVQSLDDVHRVVKLYVRTARRKGHHPTIHGIYGYIRGLDKYSFVGDYPLLQTVLAALKKISMPINRRKVLSCINKRCIDLRGRYRGKKQIIESLWI